MLLARHTARYTADSVEERPGREAGSLQFALGTYQLDQGGEGGGVSRPGDVTLMGWDGQDLKEVRRWETGGVLDLHWVDGETLLAAGADGHLHLLGDGTRVDVSPGILLAVESDVSTSAAVSDDKGSAFLVDPGRATVTDTLPGLHGARGWGAEVWALALSGSTLYTGGDDCVFRATDTRSGATVFRNTHHTMGVCCITPECSGHTLLTGSYDESLVRWDARSPRVPLASAAMGGGVWRVKGPQAGHILVAGMHSGFHVVEEEGLGVVGSYTEHGSLAYGASWLGTAGLAATCSFYDNLLTVWDALGSSTAKGS